MNCYSNPYIFRIISGLLPPILIFLADATKISAIASQDSLGIAPIPWAS